MSLQKRKAKFEDAMKRRHQEEYAARVGLLASHWFIIFNGIMTTNFLGNKLRKIALDRKKMLEEREAVLKIERFYLKASHSKRREQTKKLTKALRTYALFCINSRKHTKERWAANTIVNFLKSLRNNNVGFVHAINRYINSAVLIQRAYRQTRWTRMLKMEMWRRSVQVALTTPVVDGVLQMVMFGYLQKRLSECAFQMKDYQSRVTEWNKCKNDPKKEWALKMLVEPIKPTLPLALPREEIDAIVLLVKRESRKRSSQWAASGHNVVGGTVGS